MKKKGFKKGFLVFLALMPCLVGQDSDLTKREYSFANDKTQLYLTINNQNRNEPQNLQDMHPQISTNSNADSHASSTAQAYSFVQTQVSNFMHMLQEQCTKQNVQVVAQKAQKQLITARDVAVAFVKQHKFNIPLVLGSASYSYIFYRLVNYSYFLSKKGTWACWKDDIPLDMLKVLPEQELGKELVFAAQQQYQNAAMLTDLLTPLIFFLRDVDAELQTLQKFIKLYTWLQKLKLTYIFPFHENLVPLAHLKHQRLVYMKNVFIRWITDYKLALDKRDEVTS